MELVPDADDRRALVALAQALADQLHDRHDNAPILVETPEVVAHDMRRPPGEQPTSPDEVIARLTAAARTGWSKAHGGDLAYIPSGGLYSGAVASWLAAAVHAFTGAAFESPALVTLEESVLTWIAAVLGMPAETEGILLSGGSLANQTAVVCARADRRTGETPVAYLSPHAHHSVGKALRLSGIPADECRQIPTDDRGEIDLAAFERQLSDDQRTGATPWLIVAVAGDTDSGSIDPLPQLATLADESGAWLHIDAAYGGFFALTERGATRLAGIGAADSVTIDAHKSLFLPYGVGGLLVRHPGALARAHAADGHYFRDVSHVDELPHYFDRGPENTRPFRGLLVWLPLQLHGVASFREALDRMLDLAEGAAHQIAQIPGIEAVRRPDLSIVIFRSTSGDAATQRILDALNRSPRLHVSSTTIDGRVTIRLAFLHPRSDLSVLDEVVRIVSMTAATHPTRNFGPTRPS